MSQGSGVSVPIFDAYVSTHTAFGYPHAFAIATRSISPATVGMPPTVSCAPLLMTIIFYFFQSTIEAFYLPNNDIRIIIMRRFSY